MECSFVTDKSDLAKAKAVMYSEEVSYVRKCVWCGI